MVTTVLRCLGLALTAAYAVVCGGWLVLRLADRPGGWQAALVITAWMVPLLALTALALRRPGPTGPALAWLSTGVVEIVLLAGSVGLFPHHLVSRISAVLAFVLAVPLGAVGLHRPRLAGLVLLGLGAGYLGAVAVGTVIGGAPPGHGFWVRGWARPVGLPVPVLGLVYLVASLFRPRRRARRRPDAGSGAVGNGLRGRPARLQTRNRHPER